MPPRYDRGRYGVWVRRTALPRPDCGYEPSTGSEPGFFSEHWGHVVDGTRGSAVGLLGRALRVEGYARSRLRELLSDAGFSGRFAWPQLQFLRDCCPECRCSRLFALRASYDGGADVDQIQEHGAGSAWPRDSSGDFVSFARQLHQFDELGRERGTGFAILRRMIRRCEFCDRCPPGLYFLDVLQFPRFRPRRSRMRRYDVGTALRYRLRKLRISQRRPSLRRM